MKTKRRILITGMTRVQNNAPVRSSRANSYLSAPIIFYNMLKSAGYIVDWRPITYGEDLRMYDLIFIGLSVPNSLSSAYIFQSLWATQYPHVFFVDDWKMQGAFSGLDIDNIMREFTFNRQRLTNAERKHITRSTRTNVASLAENVMHPKTSILAPCFAWGDHTRLLEGTPYADNVGALVTVDPSPFVLRDAVFTQPSHKKSRTWVCAALYDYTDKLRKWNISWPLAMYAKESKVPEAALVDSIYPNSWGSISVPYNHAGSGWWRARFNHALMCNNILLAHPSEVGELDDPYDVYTNLSDIEKISDKNLSQLVLDQRTAFLDSMPTLKSQVATMAQLVEDNV